MIETKERWETIKKYIPGGITAAEGYAVIDTVEALREVARAVPGMFEIAELAMPDSFFQSDSRLNSMREARDALPGWLVE